MGCPCTQEQAALRGILPYFTWLRNALPYVHAKQGLHTETHRDRDHQAPCDARSLVASNPVNNSAASWLPEPAGRAQAWVKCSIKVVAPLQPTAQIFPDETAATPWRPPPGGGLGVEIVLQAVPSQCCVCMRPLLSTAQTSVDPGAVTAWSVQSCTNTPASVQAVPSQCSIAE